MGVRFQEHKNKKPQKNKNPKYTDQDSAIYEHIHDTGHSISFEDVRILAQQPKYAPRKIKEALEIHKPTLNRDGGWTISSTLLDLLPPVSGPDPVDHQGTSS